MGWFVKFGLLRLRARWRSLLTLIVGVVLAALIGANASLYTTAIAQVGLVQFLSIQPSTDTAILSRFSVAPFEEDARFSDIWSSFDEQVNLRADDAFSDLSAWAGQVYDYAETQPLIPVKAGEDIPRARLRMAYYEGIFDRVELVEGTLPQPRSSATDAEIYAEVLINAEAANLLDINVGDLLQLEQRGWDTSRPFAVRVVGLVIPLDASDPYWFDPDPLRIDTGSNTETNLLTVREDMQVIPPGFIPQTTTRFGWRIAPDYAELPYTRTALASERVEQYEIALNDLFLQDEAASSNYFFNTDIPALMAEYDAQIVFLNIPFGLLLMQLAALVLFFLILIAALVRRGERREIAMFQSRGATDAQVIAARSIESVLICVAATVIAPFLALVLLQQLLPLLTGNTQIPLELTVQSFLYAGTASLVAFVALTLTLYPVMQQPLVTAGGIGSRGGSQTIWQRYYLDVVLLVIGVIALYQLTQSQSVVASTVSDETRIDPLLLVAPTLLFVAFSSVLLRFFPAAMSLIARFYTRTRGLEGALASWQVSRQSLHYGRIAFLLALAIGIGWFAVTYQATILNNQRDQATYLVGGDLRIVYADPALPETTASMRRIAQLEDVRASSQVTRYELPSVVARSSGGRRSRQEGDLLAINPATFADVVSWRSDFGSLELPATTTELSTDIGIPIPADTERIGFWIRTSTNATITFANQTEEKLPYPPAALELNLINLRVQDETGASYRVSPVADDTPFIERRAELQSDLAPGETLWQLQDTDGDDTPDFIPRYEWANDGWVYLEADLTDLDLQGQSSLLSFGIFIRGNDFFTQMDLAIGDLQFISTTGESIRAGYTSNTADVLPVPNAAGPDELTLITPEDTTYGGSALLAELVVLSNFNATNNNFGIVFNYTEISDVDTNSQRTTAPQPPPGSDEPPPDEDEEPVEEEIIGLPVIISNSIAEINELTVGQNFNLVVNGVSPWFTVERMSEFYPTLYQERPYIVVDASLINYSLERSIGEGVPPDELWIRLNPGVDEAQFLTDLRLSDDATLIQEIISVRETINSFEADVLSLGVIGLLFISFVIGLLLSIVSLLTYISLSVQSRMGEFAVLRAMGLPATRMIISIIIEQILVLLAAIVLGAIIGQFLSLQVLPPLALSAAGGVVTPPFVLTVDWIAIAQYLGIMLLVLSIVLIFTAISIRRAATADSLRLTEEA